MASVGTQSSGNRLNQLPPSYHERWVSQDKLSACAKPGSKFKSGFPPGAKLPRNPRTVDGRSLILVPFTPDEVLNSISSYSHPADATPVLPQWTQDPIHFHASHRDDQILRHWAQTLKSVLQRAQELAPAEADLQKRVDPAVLRINKHKRTLLFQELLAACQHSDDQLIPDLQFGFRMKGWHHVSGYFPVSHQPPSLHPDSLSLCADACCKASVERVLRQANTDHDLAAQVMKATLEDIRSGSLGPGVRPDLLPVCRLDLASPRIPR